MTERNQVRLRRSRYHDVQQIRSHLPRLLGHRGQLARLRFVITLLLLMGHLQPVNLAVNHFV